MVRPGLLTPIPARNSATSRAPWTGLGSARATPPPDVRLAAGPGRAEHVERDPRGGGDQPAGDVADGLQVTALESDPGLLDGVLALGECAEQAVRDADEAGSQLLEHHRGLLGRPGRAWLLHAMRTTPGPDV